MSIEDRRDREKEEMREMILKSAEEILSLEGMEKLSIRKIANHIEYSPAIIYHYFKDKEEILSQLMSRGYQKILSALSLGDELSENPEMKLKQLTRNYIRAALQMPLEYKSAQLSSSTVSLEFTASMFQGASMKKPALKVLFECLKEMNQGEEIQDNVIELTSQIIAASTFGLIIKLIIENGIGEEQRNKLIDHYLDHVLVKMAKVIS